jgi:hypothetical protein
MVSVQTTCGKKPTYHCSAYLQINSAGAAQKEVLSFSLYRAIKVTFVLRLKILCSKTIVDKYLLILSIHRKC